MNKIGYFLFANYIISLLILSISCQSDKSKISSIPLQNWQFHQYSSTEWLPATVPGSVQTDLLANEKIPDPFFGSNEQQLQWIGESGWVYKSTFNADKIIGNDQVELVFEGLDTYAKVWLNDSLILTANNMFRQWTIPVKSLLREKDNELMVQFYPPEKIESEKASQLPYKLPDTRGFTRKAPYQYGWDWGPKFITMGIWQPVYLRSWNQVRIEDLTVKTSDVLELEAKVNIYAEFESTIDGPAKIEGTMGRYTFSEEIDLSQGINNYQNEIVVDGPELWWPNGMGDQTLYDLNLSVSTKNAIDSKSLKFGFRQIELAREKDSIGESFYFKINGLPFFAKGANYIPQDNFPARVTDDKYRQTIAQAVDANMNMLRIWGGGIYEKDLFYDLCDEMGILVWQDFMFACNMYPGDDEFLENVKQEAEFQVKRLRNHPSMALWCGNNEVSEGWFNWGWQDALNYSLSDSTEVWHNYLKIFEEILPKTVSEYSPNLPYTPSSPKIGWGHEDALYEGDMHYWGVWWGEEPFEIYKQKVGRFMSEFGFQGFPDLRTLDSCVLPHELNLHSKTLLNHQKHPRGMQLIQTYMERDFPVPDDFEDYLYVSQLVQAYGLGIAIEAQRRSMPHCMGTLYWQLNDCWPVISWSSIDYYNRWKALHYKVRELYKDVLISFEENENGLEIYGISDMQQDFDADLKLKIIDFTGNIIWQDQQAVLLKSAASSVFQNVDISGVINSKQVLVAALYSDNEIIARNLHYFVPPKALDLPDVRIKKEVTQSAEGYSIKIQSNKLAKNVFLFCNFDGHFSDNFFDLLPGEEKTVFFTTTDLIKDFDFKITSLNDLLN